MPLIRDGLLQSSQKHGSKSPRPLEGFKILDIGCGGGVLCEVALIMTIAGYLIVRNFVEMLNNYTAPW